MHNPDTKSSGNLPMLAKRLRLEDWAFEGVPAPSLRKPLFKNIPTDRRRFEDEFHAEIDRLVESLDASLAQGAASEGLKESLKRLDALTCVEWDYYYRVEEVLLDFLWSRESQSYDRAKESDALDILAGIHELETEGAGEIAGYLFASLRRRRLIRGLPQLTDISKNYMQFDISRKCNCRCRHCCNSNSPFNEEQLSKERIW